MFLNYPFLQNALAGAVLASLLCAMVGTYVVTRRTVIAGGGVAHASLGGVGLGAYFGFSPTLGAAGFALLSGFAIEGLTRRSVREDSAIAMLWTLGMSIGILMSYLTPGFMTDLPLYLFGDILGITRADLWWTGGLTLLTGGVFALLLPVIITVAYDRDFAITQGLPVRRIEWVMTALTALTIVACLRLVGIVMVISLLSVPQATAGLFVRTFRGMILVSAIAALAACLGGLYLSYTLGVPCGAAIILVSIGGYFVCRMLQSLWKVKHHPTSLVR